MLLAEGYAANSACVAYPLYLHSTKSVRWKRLSALAGDGRPKRVAMTPVTPLASTVGELRDLRHVTYDRTVAWISIARTRQVTVNKTVCGVDVSKARLDAWIEP